MVAENLLYILVEILSFFSFFCAEENKTTLCDTQPPSIRLTSAHYIFKISLQKFYFMDFTYFFICLNVNITNKYFQNINNLVYFITCNNKKLGLTMGSLWNTWDSYKFSEAAFISVKIPWVSVWFSKVFTVFPSAFLRTGVIYDILHSLGNLQLESYCY